MFALYCYQVAAGYDDSKNTREKMKQKIEGVADGGGDVSEPVDLVR